jgi:hypothetical protein
MLSFGFDTWGRESFKMSELSLTDEVEATGRDQFEGTVVNGSSSLGPTEVGENR